MNSLTLMNFEIIVIILLVISLLFVILKYYKQKKSFESIISYSNDVERMIKESNVYKNDIDSKYKDGYNKGFNDGRAETLRNFNCIYVPIILKKDGLFKTKATLGYKQHIYYQGFLIAESDMKIIAYDERFKSEYLDSFLDRIERVISDSSDSISNYGITVEKQEYILQNI